MEGASDPRRMCYKATYLPNHLPVNFHIREISFHLV